MEVRQDPWLSLHSWVLLELFAALQIGISKYLHLWVVGGNGSGKKLETTQT